MRVQADSDVLEREKALADGLRDVASELRLIDAADLIAFIRTGQLANVANLVSASTELYFKPGTVSFGQSGEVEVGWGKVPTISLDMEFRHQRVSVYFRLLLEALQAAVEIDYISFEDEAADSAENTRQLVRAIASARLGPARAAATAAG